MAWNEKDLGLVDAYGYAVQGGYTGSRAEFMDALAHYTSLQDAATAATGAANTAANAANHAASAAANAQGAAEAAAQTAQEAAELFSVDDSLTISGKAADSKTVGDTISALEESTTGQITELKNDLDEQIDDLESAFTALGLSVVNGAINITYEEVVA